MNTTKAILLVLLMSCVTCSAAASENTGESKAQDEVPQIFPPPGSAIVGAVAPMAAKAIDANLSSVALAFVTAVNDCRVALQKVELSNNAAERQKVVLAYRTAWIATLRFAASVSNEQGKSVIADAWKEGLASKTGVDIQITALGILEGPDFIQGDAITLFKATTDTKLLRAFAFYFYRHGNDANRKLVEEKLKSLKDPDQQQLMANAITYMHHELQKDKADKNDPGPPALAPTPEE
jgi:hypothetical protein